MSSPHANEIPIVRPDSGLTACTAVGSNRWARLPGTIERRVLSLEPVEPPDAAFVTLLQEQFEAALQTLYERERKVIQLRFGLLDGNPRTLEEVGRECGITPERIRQIELRPCGS